MRALAADLVVLWLAATVACSLLLAVVVGVQAALARIRAVRPRAHGGSARLSGLRTATRAR